MEELTLEELGALFCVYHSVRKQIPEDIKLSLISKGYVIEVDGSLHESESLDKYKRLFEEFRKSYLGVKRGLNTEFELLKKQKDWKAVCLSINEKYQMIRPEHQRRISKGETEMIPHLQTFIRQRRWETAQDIEPVKETDKNIEYQKYLAWAWATFPDLFTAKLLINSQNYLDFKNKSGIFANADSITEQSHREIFLAAHKQASIKHEPVIKFLMSLWEKQQTS